MHQEPTRAVTVLLRESDEVALAEMAAGLATACGRPLSIAELVRAMIQGVHASGLDITVAPTEVMLARLIADRLRP